MRPTRLTTLLLLLPIFLLPLSCSTPHSPSPPPWLGESASPRVVAILPFENLTTEPELEILVRQIFYSHFAPKSYRDVELKEVDRALETRQRSLAKPWKELSPEELGRFFNADFLIYGKVLEYSRLFLGIYSRITLKIQIEMVECKTGNGVWWKTAVKRSHEGGLPFSLFGLIPDTIRSGMHMGKEKTVALVDQLVREFVAEIPEPEAPTSSPYFLDIQIGSFLEKDLAQKTQEGLLEKGFQARIESVNVGERTYHRVLLGPYNRTEEAEAAKADLVKQLGGSPILIQHTEHRDSPTERP